MSELPIQYLSVEDVLLIRDRLAADLADPDAFSILRFQQLLSAIAAPQQHLFGEELFPTLPGKAAALLVRLIRNHPFWDGNKRIALAAAMQFLERNGHMLVVTPAEADRFTTLIAKGDEDDAAARLWVEQRTRKGTR